MKTINVLVIKTFYLQVATNFRMYFSDSIKKQNILDAHKTFFKLIISQVKRLQRMTQYKSLVSRMRENDTLAKQYTGETFHSMELMHPNFWFTTGWKKRQNIFSTSNFILKINGISILQKFSWYELKLGLICQNTCFFAFS